MRLTDHPTGSALAAVVKADHHIAPLQHPLVSPHHTLGCVCFLYQNHMAAGAAQTAIPPPVCRRPLIRLAAAWQNRPQLCLWAFFLQPQHRFGKQGVTASGHAAEKHVHALVTEMTNRLQQAVFQQVTAGVLLVLAPGQPPGPVSRKCTNQGSNLLPVSRRYDF